MGVKAELSDFLTHLPAVDYRDERKALLTYTGPSGLGIYLNWEGSNVEFTERLLEELSRRGKGSLSGFLAALPNTPQVANSIERQEQVVALRAQVDALDEVAFRAQFPVPLLAAPAEAPAADPAMLAAAVVNEVLAPYYKLGADQLRQKAGGRAAALAERMAEKVEPALASDLGASAVFDIFKQSPEAGQVGMLKVLKAKLAGDPALAGELANLFTSAAAEPEGGGLQALVNVSQEIGVVKGDVVGAVVGDDVLKGIGSKIDVDQNIGTVEPGAVVTGVVIGGSGPINIGGQHNQGDVYSGDFRGAMLNVRSSLQNVTQSIDNIQGADQSAKDELQDLVGQLTAALKQVPPDRVQDAEAVAGMTEDVVKRASADKPNSSLLNISAEGLKKAAENIADVMPTVLGIATQIVAVISGLAL